MNPTIPTLLIEPSSTVGAEREALKQQFLECLRAIRTSATALGDVAARLFRLGTSKRTLLRWAVEAGYNERYVRNVINHVCRQAGLCRRRSGAGPRTPQEALIILAFATDRYGGRAEKLLRAAAHAAKVQRLAQAAQGPAHFAVASRP